MARIAAEHGARLGTDPSQVTFSASHDLGALPPHGPRSSVPVTSGGPVTWPCPRHVLAGDRAPPGQSAWRRRSWHPPTFGECRQRRDAVALDRRRSGRHRPANTPTSTLTSEDSTSTYRTDIQMDNCHFSRTADELALTIALDPGTDRTLIIRLSGELDMDSVDALHETLAEALRHRFNRVMVDLSELLFCDSSGIRALLLGHAEADRIGCEFVAVAPRPFVRRVFELTGVTALLGIESAENS
ncbi:STAS domain-containing protein [Micromonosporaceae bacterium B7E4]